MLILAGITINSLTGSDSAPAKANEAAQKNDIGTAKDEISLLAVNAKTEGYETAYVGNGVSAGDASKTVGQAVIDAVKAKNGTNVGKASIEVLQAETNSVKGDATITITTRDFEVEGTITIQDGILTWGEIEANIPGIKITGVPKFLAKDNSITLDIKRKDVTGNAKWTSDKTTVATVEENTGKVTGIAAGTATITASVTENGTTYTAECEILVKEIVMPQVGDFVTYDAGDWTTDSSGNIIIHYTDGTTEAVADSETKPSTDHKFGGFTTASGKNGNATPSKNSYDYVKDGDSAVTGWRIFDIDGDKITLISAGCPEDYYHKNSANNGYKSEYILTGNNPTNIDVSGLRVRDWTADYGDSSNKITASVLTKAKLEDWYTKYITNGTSADILSGSTFKKIYKTNENVVNSGKYESLIDNYSYYWLAFTYSGNPSTLFIVRPNPNQMDVSNELYSATYGVRVLVSLPSSISLTQNPIGTKTITSRSNDYTYNVWRIN